MSDDGMTLASYGVGKVCTCWWRARSLCMRMCMCVSCREARCSCAWPHGRKRSHMHLFGRGEILSANVEAFDDNLNCTCMDVDVIRTSACARVQNVRRLQPA